MVKACIHHCELNSFPVVIDFLVTNLCNRIMHEYKIWLTHKVDQWILMLTEYAMQRSDCTLQTTCQKLQPVEF